MNNFITKLTDPYERKARLWPALLTILPLIVTIVLLYATILSALTNIALIMFACGALYLMGSVTRQQGKKMENKLYAEWGGKPTTQLLRHSNKVIESISKERYHKFLSSKVNISFPSPEVELHNTKDADEIYQSAVSWLLNQTRDHKKFYLLFAENITYGFYRNALGIKPIGIIIAVGTMIWILINYGVFNATEKYFINIEAIINLPRPAFAAIAMSLLMLLVWLLFITKKSLCNAAFTYAETLLRSCDILESKN